MAEKNPLVTEHSGGRGSVHSGKIAGVEGVNKYDFHRQGAEKNPIAFKPPRLRASGVKEILYARLRKVVEKNKKARLGERAWGKEETWNEFITSSFSLLS